MKRNGKVFFFRSLCFQILFSNAIVTKRIFHTLCINLHFISFQLSWNWNFNCEFKFNQIWIQFNEIQIPFNVFLIQLNWISIWFKLYAIFIQIEHNFLNQFIFSIDWFVTNSAQQQWVQVGLDVPPKLKLTVHGGICYFVKIIYLFKNFQATRSIWNILRIFYFYSGMLKINQ